MSKYNRQGKKRVYKKIDSQTIAEFIASKLDNGNNGTETVRQLSPEYKTPHDRAHSIQTKAETTPIEIIDSQLQSNAVKGIKRIEELIDSDREQIALQASIYSVDQYKGKAIQRTHNLNQNINIQSVLD